MHFKIYTKIQNLKKLLEKSFSRCKNESIEEEVITLATQIASTPVVKGKEVIRY